MKDIIKTLRAMLTREQRRKFGLLQVLFCFTAVLQVAGAASIAPFVALLSNKDLIHRNQMLNYLYEVGGFQSDLSFMIAFALLVMAVIAVSNAILGVSTWLTLFFSLRTGQEFQRSIYRNYLHREYVYFSRKNSSELISIVTQESPRLVYNVLMPFLNLTSQGLVILLIAGGLLYLDWVIAVSALITVGGGYFFVFRLIKSRLVFHGQNIWKTNNARLKLLTESLGGVKEVKLLGTERFYEERIAEVNAVGLRSNAIIGLFGDLPKFVLETIAFCAMLGLATYLLASRGGTDEIVAMLSLYAMAGYKLLPAAQTVFKAISQIKANGDVVHELYPQVIAGRNLATNKVGNSDGADETPAARINGDLRLVDVTYHYPGAALPAVKNVNLTIRRNSLVALVGPSGAGKSTIADVFLGMLEPTAGKFLVGDTVIDSSTVRQWQKSLGYVPQSIFILDDTVTSNISFGLPGVDSAAVKAAARMANIDKFVESLPGQYDYIVGERGALLSGGQRQRIGIARALYRNADVLIMDEATSALDSLTEKEIISTICDLKTDKTIVMIAHRLATIKSADVVVFVNEGLIHDCGTYEELEARNALFRNLVLANVEASAA